MSRPLRGGTGNGLRVTLIQPRVGARSAFERLGRSHLPPLGMLYVAASLEAAGHRVRVLDLNLDPPPRRDLARLLRGEDPADVVGIATLAPTRRQALGLGRRLREALPARVPLVAGGPDVTVRPGAYARAGVFDALLLGEAEHTMVALCEAWPRVPRGVLGILPAGEDPAGAARPAAVDPDAVPLPARHLLPLRRYRGGPAFKRLRHATSLFSHRGCPYRCTFCEKGVHDGPVRLRSAEGILDEVRRIRRDHGIHDIRFIDDVFLVNPRVVRAFLELVLRCGERFSWMSTARVDLVTPELLRLMRRAGCYRLELGVESGDDRMLARINKGITTGQARRALGLVREAGLESIANFIMGFPGETEAQMRRTAAFARELDPDYAVFFTFEPLAGAPVVRSRRVAGQGSDNHAMRPAVPPERLAALVREAYARFYFRPRTVARRLAAAPPPWQVADLARLAGAFVLRR